MRAEWVPYGRAAAEALRSAVADAKGTEPLAPVTVVVPSNHVGVATRRLLASGSLGPVCGRGIGLAAVSFLTTYRLAELLGAPVLAGAGRRPVSTPVIAAAVRAALADDPGAFAPVAHHPATEAALVASYRDLRDVSPAGLAALAGAGRRVGEVVRIHHAIRERLARRWYDEQDLMAAATEVVSAPGSGAGLGTVVVHLPQLLSRPAAGLLAAVGGATDVVVLAGRTGDERADAEVARSLARLGVVAAGGPPAPDPNPAHGLVGPDRTRIVTTSDGDDELRGAVRAVIDATRSGTPLDRIAILHAGPGPYGRLAHEHLAAAGIASNGPSVVPLAARMAGRFLLGLLALPERGFQRAEVLAWMSDAPIRVDDRRIPIDRWEVASREAGVVGGRADWDDRLARRAAESTARAERYVLEGRDGAAESARRHAGYDATLRAFVLDLIDSVDRRSGTPQGWDRHAAWARDLLAGLLGGASARASWPVAEQKATERVEAALDRLAALAEVEGPVALAVFQRTLELELENDLGRVGRFGEGVLVGPVSMGIGLDLDLVVVVGLAEGTLPALVHDDSLLPDHDREATGDELPLRRSRVDAQHRHFLAALASGASQLLTFPRGDLRRSVERVPSRWLLDVASALAGTRWWSPTMASADEPWLTRVGSFDAGLRHLTFPATAQEHRLRELLADPRPSMRLTDPTDPVMAAGALLVEGRRSPRFTRFDGNLAGVAVPSPVDVTASATSLERWARCPHAYFQDRILGVREPDHPEDSLRITARDRGSLVHLILERFILEAFRTHGADGPGPDHPWSASDRANLLALAEVAFAEAEADGKTGRTIFWRRDRSEIERDLLRFLVDDSLHRLNTRSRPLAAELRFGFPDAPVGPVEMPLADGRTVSFHGAADRVDQGEDGTVYVVDYKTGSAGDFKKLTAESPTLGGALLQLPIYGQAARELAGTPDAPVKATYWFVSKKGEFARPGYFVDDGVLAQVSTDLTFVVAGIEAGVFPPHPTADSTTPWVVCAYCDPDGLGVGDLRRQWEAKRRDPRMAAYADAVEPPAMPDDGGPDA